MYKPILTLILFSFGCGGGDAPTRYLNGKFELFVGVDVEVEQCSGQQFNGIITLTASDLAEEQPDYVQIFFMECEYRYLDRTGEMARNNRCTSEHRARLG